ncbi:aldehyde dehydrogenase family protein [Bacillus sp. ISL-34]|nr:aldehyde dehydrogenase family protein [Bacillus sp. ISL-34]
MTIEHEEIFRPVFGVSVFDGVEEAMKFINDTPY